MTTKIGSCEICDTSYLVQCTECGKYVCDDCLLDGTSICTDCEEEEDDAS